MTVGDAGASGSPGEPVPPGSAGVGRDALGLGLGLGGDDGEGVDGSGLDAGTATAELDIDGALLDVIEGELADVEQALALIDEGTYGQCEACGRTIDDSVLARTPTARFCAEHLPLALR